ncbi:MAG: hypothetical protein M0Z66_09470 [Thermaerobacter sp.]|nr:hypothetical protein [Thermaerobacter sp.]
MSALDELFGEIAWIAVWALALGLSIGLYAAITWLQWASARSLRG